jgi:hypothetical protein
VDNAKFLELLVEIVGPTTYRAKQLREGGEPTIYFREIVEAMQRAFAAGEAA